MKKIMFNDKYELTKAVLEGRKTQTRRIIKIDSNIGIAGFIRQNDGSAVCGQLSNEGVWKFGGPESTYKIGEEIAIAQRYSECFRAVWLENSKGWNNKMFVISELMPHRIKITDIRVERLQDISEGDCLKEGFELIDVNNNWSNAASHYEYRLTYHDKLGRTKQLGSKEYKEAFSFLIDNTCGIATWERNPYVFVYEFRLIK